MNNVYIVFYIVFYIFYSSGEAAWGGVKGLRSWRAKLPIYSGGGAAWGLKGLRSWRAIAPL